MRTPWRIALLGVFTRDTYQKASAFDADGKKVVFDDAAILRETVRRVNVYEALAKSHANLQRELGFMIKNWHREHHVGETSSDLTMAESVLKECVEVFEVREHVTRLSPMAAKLEALAVRVLATVAGGPEMFREAKSILVTKLKRIPGRHLSNIRDPNDKFGRMGRSVSYEVWQNGPQAMEFERQMQMQWVRANLIRRPKATKFYSVEQLEDMHMVGLYQPLYRTLAGWDQLKYWFWPERVNQFNRWAKRITSYSSYEAEARQSIKGTKSK